METYKFCGSTRHAVSFVLSLQRRGRKEICPSLTAPDWRGFTFFSSIQGGKTDRKLRVEATASSPGYWKVERTIHFLIGEHVVATVKMEGERYDKNSDCPAHSAWRVTWFNYARIFSSQQGPMDWAAASCPSSGLTVTDL